MRRCALSIVAAHAGPAGSTGIECSRSLSMTCSFTFASMAAHTDWEQAIVVLLGACRVCRTERRSNLTCSFVYCHAVLWKPTTEDAKRFGQASDPDTVVGEIMRGAAHVKGQAAHENENLRRVRHRVSHLRVLPLPRCRRSGVEGGRLRRPRRARLFGRAARDRAQLDRRARRRQTLRRRHRHAGVLAEGAATATKEQLEAMIPSGTATSSRRRSSSTTCRLCRRTCTPETLLGWVPSGGQSHVDVALHAIKLLVNALGPPPEDVVERAHSTGSRSPRWSARRSGDKQREAGVDIIVASGTEAGGHTGEIATMVLVPEWSTPSRLRRCSRRAASATGRQMRPRSRSGPTGVDRIVWLTSKETRLQPAVVEMLRATSRDTVRSRAMTGKPARQLARRGPTPGTRPTRPARCRCRCSSW